MNGTSLRPPSSLSEASEESFVVLSSSALQIDSPKFPSISSINSILATPNTMSTSVASELSSEEIHSKLESLLQENLQLKATLQQNNLAMKKQFTTLVMWQEDIMKVHESHKEKFEETKKLIANLRAENAELRKSASLPFNENEVVNLKSKISALEFELDTLRQGNIKFKNDQTKIIQELEIKLSESEKTKDEQTTKLKIQIDDLTTQLQTIEEQHKQTQEKLQQSIAKIESNENIKKQLSDELILKNKILKNKTELIDDLHEEIGKLKMENETIPILKTQVDVYSTDFNQEREARSELKAQRDRLAEDLQHLQRRNQQLLEEVEKMSRDRFVYVQQNGASAPQAPTTSPRPSPTRDNSPPFASSFMCPVCSGQFRSLNILEEHIDSCLLNASS